MLKKTILLWTVLLTALTALPQNGVGTWRVHPFYVGSDLRNVIDTETRVYYQAGNYLFAYDKETQENESYSQQNYLNDVTVTGIYYNYDRNYLVVAYENSSMDVIFDSGKVVYLPDIKDASLSTTKSINDITFANDEMLVATPFGYVIYDAKELEVKMSHIYNTAMSSVTHMGTWHVAAIDGTLRIAPDAGHNETISAFNPLGDDLPAVPNAQLLTVNANTLLVNTDNGLFRYEIETDPAGTPKVSQYITLVGQRAATVQPTSTGFIASYLTADSCYYTLDQQGQNVQRVNAGAELFSSHPEGDGTLWALADKGLHQAGDTQNYYKPDGIGIKTGAFHMAYSEDLGKLYLSSTSDNQLGEWGSVFGAVTQIYAYDGYQWSDVTPSNLPGNGVSANWQLVFDPFDSHTYVYPSRKYGVVKVTDDKIVNVYDEINSLFAGSSFYKGACAFDSEGNLWVVYSSASASTESAKNVAVLPRAKYEQQNVTASDWISVSVPGTKQEHFKGSNLVIANDVKVYNSGGYEKAFAFWYEANGLSGTPLRATYSNFMDQDGKTVSWLYVYSIVADHNGTVWAGMDNGVISFDPTDAFDDNFTINHIKVPRNDGTGLADYLLDGTQINCIAVDGANRKWLGTNGSGLFLVSADGSEVLKQFTTDNSFLSTNIIYNVCCDPTSNSVFIVTPNGVLEYFSDTTPGAVSYSNVYVYPNPVRPDFTGTITINGLMDNSLVKIADSGGHVVKQLRSTGGMATWDCCNESGERCSTGVYYVLASEKEGGSSHATVAKFLIVK